MVGWPLPAAGLRAPCGRRVGSRPPGDGAPTLGLSAGAPTRAARPALRCPAAVARLRWSGDRPTRPPGRHDPAVRPAPGRPAGARRRAAHRRPRPAAFPPGRSVRPATVRAACWAAGRGGWRAGGAALGATRVGGRGWSCAGGRGTRSGPPASLGRSAGLAAPTVGLPVTAAALRGVGSSRPLGDDAGRVDGRAGRSARRLGAGRGTLGGWRRGLRRPRLVPRSPRRPYWSRWRSARCSAASGPHAAGAAAAAAAGSRPDLAPSLRTCGPALPAPAGAPVAEAGSPRPVDGPGWTRSAAVRLADRTGAPLAELVERIEADARAADRGGPRQPPRRPEPAPPPGCSPRCPLGGIALGYAIGVDPRARCCCTPRSGLPARSAPSCCRLAGLLWAERLGARRAGPGDGLACWPPVAWRRRRSGGRLRPPAGRVAGPAAPRRPRPPTSRAWRPDRSGSRRSWPDWRSAIVVGGWAGPARRGAGRRRGRRPAPASDRTTAPSARPAATREPPTCRSPRTCSPQRCAAARPSTGRCMAVAEALGGPLADRLGPGRPDAAARRRARRRPGRTWRR